MHIQKRFLDTDLWQQVGIYNSIAVSKGIPIVLRYHKNLNSEFDLISSLPNGSEQIIFTGTLEQAVLSTMTLVNYLRLF